MEKSITSKGIFIAQLITYSGLIILGIRKYEFYIHSPENPVVAIRNFFYKREMADSILLPNPNLIELCGQSNAVGMAGINDLAKDLKLPNKHKLIFNEQLNRFEPIKPGVNSAGCPEKSFNNHFGIETRLMDLLQHKYGQNQYLIKYGIGGTQLQRSNVELDWSANSVNEYFDHSNERHFSALKALKDNRPPLAFIWIQGKNDTFADKANNYQRNLEQFINEKRKSYGYSNMPFIIVRLINKQTSLTKKYFEVVRAAQEQISTEANNYLVDADNLPVVTNIHYDAASFNVLATEVFQIVNKLKKSANLYTRVITPE